MKTPDDLQRRLAQVVAQEQALLFDHFNHETAWRLGQTLVLHAQTSGALQTVFDIRRNGQILFRASLAGSSADNEHWVQAKLAVLHRFGVSTERKKLEFQGLMNAEWLRAFPNGGGDPLRFWNLSPLEASGLVGGGFPIQLKGSGMVGSIVVSGGPDAADHDFIATVLQSFLHIGLPGSGAGLPSA